MAIPRTHGGPDTRRPPVLSGTRSDTRRRLQGALLGFDELPVKRAPAEYATCHAPNAICREGGA